jgi:hypothetical protein
MRCENAVCFIFLAQQQGGGSKPVTILNGDVLAREENLAGQIESGLNLILPECGIRELPPFTVGDCCAEYFARGVDLVTCDGDIEIGIPEQACLSVRKPVSPAPSPCHRV